MLLLPSGPRLFAALLILAAVVMPGCSEDSGTVSVTPAPPATHESTSASPTPAATTKVTGTPTVPAPSPMPTQVLADVRRCRLMDLWIVRGGENGAGQHVLHYVLIGNRSLTPCVLQGYPTFELFDEAGRAIPFQFWSGDEAGMPVLLKPGLHRPRAHHGRKGQAGFILTNVSPHLCAHLGPAVASATIGVPGDPAAIQFDMSISMPTVCNGSIGVGPFTPLG